MSAVEAARQEAERVHFSAVALGANPENLLEFAQWEAERRGIEAYSLGPDDPQLKGGKAVFDSQAGVILYANTGSEFDRAFLIAHELGHVVIEGGTQDTVTIEVEQDRSIEDAPVGIEKVLDYGARERREVRMDIFAREFLIPRSVVRHLHVDDGVSSADIAIRFGTPLQVIQQQLLDALLLPADESEKNGSKTSSTTWQPDSSQILAAKHRNSPFMLEAGPGTGKTKTLISRLESLLAEGVNPSSILVITFSNKAANELSERLAASNPSAAAAMWIGTFHAFGLDIIRRFHDKLELPPDPRLVDKSEAIGMLEDELPRLPLRHFRNLWDPTLDLNEMLSAISRAKDEVFDASGYRALAQAMLDKAKDTDAIVRAEKCLEVALLFETYERLMTENQWIDFGDLVALPVRLVESNVEVMEALRARHKHVLVDEYQDVNRASVRLLKAMVGDGKNLWVVGDTRQSIYRFRGASASNMALFSKDFPGAKIHQLGVNYRSGKEIVDIFSAFSKTMRASADALPLKLSAERGLLGENPEYRVAGSADDEISAVAAAIKEQHEAGVPYRKQALLCVSNSRLSQIAEGLEERGFPVLHLGSVFERPEIKNLLALLSMLTDPYAVGLMRVSTMPEFNIPLQDVIQIIEYLKQNKGSALDWRQAPNQISGIEIKSQEALRHLAELFDGLARSSTPWMTLARWIIDDLGLAKSIYLAESPQNRLKGVALWQFLNFCRHQPQGAGFPSVRLLDRIRRLVLISEDTSLRQMPAAADGIDAVRLMTIHGSKGLEFHTLHMPGMVTSGLPRNNKPPRCVPPDGLIYGSQELTGLEAVKAGHDEEEECLFFVALSRARNKLFLYSSSVQSNGNRRNPSKFISPIKHFLSHHPAPPRLVGNPAPPTQIKINWADNPTWNDTQISLFERCPRRFLYAHVLLLGGRRTETAFMKMHNAVNEMFSWLKIEHATETPSDSEIEAQFEKVWQAKGDLEHGYSDEYRRNARHLINHLVAIRRDGTLIPATPIVLGLGESDVLVHPDSVVRSNTGKTIVRRIKTGKFPSNAFDAIEYTLLHLAALQAYGSFAQIEVTFLTSEVTEQMSLSSKKLKNRQKKLQGILQSVLSGDFPSKKEGRTCPRCPSFFICGNLPSGSLTTKKSD